ncbi:iron ABC transporter substrate-binding protein [Burkholderia sp. WAC0059]|uniref:ABC transporter substrate-binding protein n=1 Tax=Burkholderia sp. WAC0059 TaxID=2066022 RepID=UPI000C7F3CE9|nr:ABC transporter substrate-binding protein [Burkholderia sp. WAC0059]PLZ02522.1 iron ABC transporter substrate-binding protein [Burkholderia sp. WAC0059]
MSPFRLSAVRQPVRAAASALAAVFLFMLAPHGAQAQNAPGTAAPAAAATAPQTITDLAGRTVRIPAAAPQRILLGESRLLMAVALLEGQHPLAHIVGWQGDLPAFDPQTWQSYAQRFPQITKIPLIGGDSEASVSPEKALALRPDVAILSIVGEGAGEHNPLVDQLEAAGTTVVFVDFRVHPLKDTLQSIKVLGAILHRNAEAAAYSQFYSAHLQHVEQVVNRIPENQRPKVFVDLLAGAWGGGCCHTAGNGNFGEFVTAAGGRNIAAPLVPGVLGDVSMEEVIAAQPDVYVATGSHSKPGQIALRVGALTSEADAERSLGQLVSRPGFDAIKAIHDGRAHGLSHNYYDSPYNIVAIEALAKWFYPQQFKNLDVSATQAELYRRFLAVPPTGTYWIDKPAN